MDDHAEALELRSKIQSDEKDSRDDCREEIHFNADKDGHWDSFARNLFADKPRYQFDHITPVVDAISGRLEQKEFGGNTLPVDGKADDEVAKVYDKMLRTIGNISCAQDIYKDMVAGIVDHGFEALRVVTDWADVDSFDQDIMLEYVPNAIDRVWLEGVAGATKHSDIKRGFVDTVLSKSEYEKKFPEGSATSVSEDNFARYRESGSESVTVTDFYYLKDREVTLILMNNHAVYELEEYEKAKESLLAKGITPVMRNGKPRLRKKKIPECFFRKMDAGGWLTDEQPTPFSYIPIVPCYGNFKVLEKRALYHGATRPLMDAQRIYDYSVSRDIADGALAPVEKIVMSVKQGEGLEEEHSDLHKSSDPRFRYVPDEMAPAPYKMPANQPNPALNVNAERAKNDIRETASSFEPQRGSGLTGHSGKAYELLTERADTTSYKYERAILKTVQTANMIAVDAIPKVYDTKNRQMRLINEDGTSETVTVNEQVRNDDGTIGTINDLSHGHYAFRAKAGVGYSSQKAQTAESFLNLAQIKPELLDEGADIFYASMDGAGFDQLSERRRLRMIEEGQIPESQLTDEEREKIIADMQAQQQNQQPDPMQQATVAAIMAQVQDLQSQMEARQSQLQIDMMEQQRKMMETVSKNQVNEANITKIFSDALKSVVDASGADAVMSPAIAGSIQATSQEVIESTRQV